MPTLPKDTQITQITVASATRQGTREANADSAAVHTLYNGTVGAAIVDGIGSSAEIAAYAHLAANVAARIGPRRTSILGLLAAAELNAAPFAEPISPDGVAVLAVAAPDEDETSIAWTGDARAYGYDGNQLHQRTTDMTVADYLRANGYPVVATTRHEDWIRASLGRSTINTVHQAHITDRLILLTSDGVHKQITHERLAELVREHADDPQVLADAVVAEPQADQDGYRDDATVIVILRTPHTDSTIAD